ncbi:MAG: hypothetical protein JXB88_09295 [Spirochaetales bacterium]|nr:hypothetical protein [Spirochaetales bacterium]
MKKILLTLAVLLSLLFFIGCPGGDDDDPETGGTIMDLTMESSTNIDTYVTNGDIYASGGTGPSVSVSSETANGGTQSLLTSSTIDPGSYVACEARVKMQQVTGAARDLTNCTITCYVYVPSGQGTDPDYVQFTLWNTDNWSQLQDSGYEVTLDTWTLYTLDVSDYVGAGGATAWGYEGLNGGDTKEKIIQDVDELSVKAGISSLVGGSQATIFYIDDFKIVED